MKNLWKGVKNMAKETVNALNSAKVSVIDNIAKGTATLFTDKKIMMAAGVIVTGVGVSMMLASKIAM